MNLYELTYKIRGTIFIVHSVLGPGLLESVYEAALVYELVQMGLNVQAQVGVPVNYNEIKSLDILHDVHKKQLLTYLKLTGKKIGILVNFKVATLTDKQSIIRIIN